jgi:hypothetical protein
MHFSGDLDRVMTSGVVEVHRLSNDSGTRKDARKELNIDFPAYIPWAALAEELRETPGSPTMEISAQGEFLEYRALGTKVSVHVVDSHEGRDEWPGRGDVWSVSLG